MQCALLTLLVCSTNGWQLRTRRTNGWQLRTRRARIIRYAEDAASLQQAADALRAEAASLEATLPCTTTPPPAVITELPGSTWRFACRLDEGKSFDFVATLERETNPEYLADDANRYREAGPLALIDPGPSIRRAYGWLAEDDGPPKGEFTRITVSMKDGMLASTDGDLMYLQARVKRGASVTLDEGTLTVKRQRPGTRFLFVEYPSLVADLKIVGSFSATPSSKSPD
jgi:hypothetical protein